MVFLDEPTTGLDIQSRDDLWHAVDRLREDGATIVLTTHYLEEGHQRADRIGLMHNGTFHREGTVSELTRTLPATIRFALPGPAPALPLRATHERATGGSSSRPSTCPGTCTPCSTGRCATG